MQDNQKNLYFPEAIYLKPDLESQVQDKQYAFQWYVDSEIDTTTHTAVPRTGENKSTNIYFYYENAENVNFSYKWFTTYGAQLRGGSITVGGSSFDPGEKIQYEGNCIFTDIDAGMSPVIDTDSSGCYIEWTISFKDKTDKKTKTAKAYTYVYKPNVQPVGAGITANNFYYDDFYNSHLTWVSGIHSLESDFHLTPEYYPVVGGRYSLVPFASSNRTNEKQRDLYIQFPGYFDTNTSNSGSVHWMTSGSSNYFTAKSFRFFRKDFDSSGIDEDLFCLAGIMGVPSGITIDSSRYTNLNQIPNLSCGMMVTDDEASDDGAILSLSNRDAALTEDLWDVDVEKQIAESHVLKAYLCKMGQ